MQAGLIAIEDAEYEKDGEVRRFRKVSLTEAGLSIRTGSPANLLISDGIVEEFGTKNGAAIQSRKMNSRAAAPGKGNGVQRQADVVLLTPEGEALEGRIKEWRAGEAKRLRVPAYVVLHDRTVKALAGMRPRNPKQLLEIEGIGPAKVEKFGAAILGLCGD